MTHLLSRALILLIGVVPRIVTADDDPDTETARRHFDRGIEFYGEHQEHQYAAAIKEFEIARKVMPVPAYDFNLGRCYDRIERPAAATVAYERYLQESPGASDVAAVRARVGALRARMLAEYRALTFLQRDAVDSEVALHLSLGAEFVGGEDWFLAAKEFKKAYLLKRDPLFLLRIAEAYDRLAADRDNAIYYYRKYLAEFLGAPDRLKIESRIRSLAGPHGRKK